MVIQSASFMTLLRLSESLPVFLEDLERSRPEFSPLSLKTPTVMIDHQRASV